MSVQTAYSLEHVAAVEGGIVDAQLKNIRSKAAEVAIPFGRVVARGTNPDQCKLPTTAGEVGGALGVSVRVQNRAPAAIDDVLRYEVEDDVSIINLGTVWMVTEDAVVAGQPVFVRHVAGAGEELGRVRSDADGTDATQLTGATFDEAAGIGELVRVRLNLI